MISDCDFAARTKKRTMTAPEEHGVHVISAWSNEVQKQLDNVFYGAKIIAFDSEGVDLGRMGTISIVQLGTPASECFIVDVLGKGIDDALIRWLRTILQDPEVKKVVHDCRMDSDALLHHLKIQLTNVHDTSAWHEKVAGLENKPLNTVLAHNGLAQNATRDKSVYKSNRAFWATRPITPQMVNWASGDLADILQLADRQINSANSKMAQDAVELSINFVQWARTAQVQVISVQNVGRFIGKGGSNIHSLQRKTGTLVYGYHSGRANTFLVYYDDQKALNQVLARAT